MRIGITGHQDLGDNQIVNWIKINLKKQLGVISPSRAYSCLALGADQLFAEEIINLEIPLVAVIPCEKYVETFPDDKKTRFHQLLNKCSDVVYLPYNSPSETAFYEAGKRVVENSDIMIAVWNQKPAKGLGGTGDIVSYALSLKRTVVNINILNKSINILNYEQ